jgi:Glu-tRNA(Gln) amidotransferase subunit E-like FAD-binding protein
MEHFFSVVGLCSIVLLLLYILGVYDKFKMSEDDFVEDTNIYKVAQLFEQKKLDKSKIKELLLKCIDFDEEEAEEIILRAEKARNEENSGYVEFIKVVNKVLNKNIYNIHLHKK